jgi:nucleoside-diphosphate-sugar epimerase
MESAVGQEFNLASGAETRIIDLANMVNGITGNRAGVKLVERRNWDKKSRLLASVERARELIGYEPETTFEDGLDRAVQWFREHWDDIERSARFGPGVSSAVREMAVTEAKAGVQR